MVSAVTVILGAITILRVVAVLSWIGLRTMEIATNRLIGMIPRMDRICLDMEVMVESQQTSMAAQNTQRMVPIWTFKLGPTVTMAMAKHMQCKVMVQLFIHPNGLAGCRVTGVEIQVIWVLLFTLSKT